MNRFLAQRLALALLQVFLVGTTVFALIHLIPGDPVLIILGSERLPDPEVIEAVRARLGLDQPLHVQYVNWLAGLVRGDFGRSLVNELPVLATIAERLPRTLQLVGTGMLLATLFGIPLGIVAALQWNTFWDRALTFLAAVGISAPVYVVGTLLVLFFGVRLRWLPISGYVDLSEGLGEFLRRLVLPAITLSLGPMATITRMTRSSLLEVRHQDYIRTAQAKGLTGRVVVSRHMLRNALIPVVTVIGLQMGTLIGGAVLVEYIFRWPGLSTALVTAIGRRDYPVVQGIVLVSASLFVLINLLVDIAYGYLDPRVRHA